jgi:hypothetical protein
LKGAYSEILKSEQFFAFQITDVILLQPEKANSPMLVTLVGIVIFVKPEQLLKALYPMLVTLFGIVIEVKPLQPLKA